MSISISLVAVFIPLLFMGGILGRLFHEFAMTLTLAIAVSAAVSLSLTPMMCGRFMQPPRRRPHRPAWAGVDRGGGARLPRRRCGSTRATLGLGAAPSRGSCCWSPC